MQTCIIFTHVYMHARMHAHTYTHTADFVSNRDALQCVVCSEFTILLHCAPYLFLILRSAVSVVSSILSSGPGVTRELNSGRVAKSHINDSQVLTSPRAKGAE